MLRFLQTCVLFCCCGVCFQTMTAASPQFGAPWKALVGTWTSEASSGVGPGTCEFRFELADHILVRTNHAEAIPGGGRSSGGHDDLMVIYPAQSESKGNATYWD